MKYEKRYNEQEINLDSCWLLLLIPLCTGQRQLSRRQLVETKKMIKKREKKAAHVATNFAFVLCTCNIVATLTHIHAEL